MALPVWGGLLIFWVLEVVDQNLAELARFAPPSPGKGRREIVLEGSIPSDFHLSESLRKEAGAKTRCGQRARGRSQIYQYSPFWPENKPRSQVLRCWFSLEQVWAAE